MENELDSMTTSALDRTSRIIDKYGPRLVTTEPCNNAAKELYNEMNQFCDNAAIESFWTKPTASIGFLKPMSVLYYLGLVSLWIGIPFGSWVLNTISVMILVFEYLLYYHFTDLFYPGATANNIYGVIEPQGEVKKVVIFSGHHDSAHIFNFFVDHPEIYGQREKKFVIVILTNLIFNWVYAFMRLKDGTLFSLIPESKILLMFKIIFTMGIIHIYPMWFYTDPNGTPGAGDNLIASSMSVELAKHFSQNKTLKNTRLVFASFDGEEICLRGSREFYKKHKKEFEGYKTYNFNVDCAIFLEDLKFLVSDINGFLPLSKPMAEQCVRIAAELGYKATTHKLPFLTGGTDAAEAARAGCEAITLLGIPFNANTKDVPYHTMKDTVDKIEPKIIEATMNIFMHFVDEIDRE